MALHSLYCAHVPLRNCSLTHSFISHIKHLKEKCTKALNLLRVIAHTTWGADQQTLLHLYSH